MSMSNFGKIYSQIERANPSLIAQFKELGVSTIYESMVEETLMDPSITPICKGQIIAGSAVTAINTPGDNLSMHLGLSLTQPGDILVTAFLGTHSYNALWGEMATLAGIGRKISGVIADGAVRDVKAILANQFPVWAKSISSKTSSVEKIGGINVPAVCGGVLVNPGDIIVADDDGVVVVPLEQADEILQKAQKRAEREKEIKDLLLQGKTPYEIFNMGIALEKSDIPIINDKYDSMKV